MIKSGLKEVMESRNIKSIHSLSKNTGVSRRLITNLYRDDFDYIDKIALDKLCEYLNCKVEDIIKRDP